MGPPYKDKMGRYRTESLFREKNRVSEDYPPIFTLKENDYTDSEGKVYPSMRRIFLSYNDPTGYKFAKEVLGSYEHWKRLCSKDWFSEHLEIWLQELEVKLQSEGLEKIREVAASKSTASVQASKFLAEKRWKPSNKVGRPNKDKIEQGPSDSELDEDFNRITG